MTTYSLLQAPCVRGKCRARAALWASLA